MLGIILGAFVLIGAMFVVGRHEAELSLPKALLIAAGVSILTAIASIFLGIFALVIAFGLCWFGVYKLCYLGAGKSAAVAGIYVVVTLAINIGLILLRSS